jgi:hypothetical protein
LLDINTTVSVVVGLSLIPTAWFKEKWLLRKGVLLILCNLWIEILTLDDPF